MLPVVGFVIVAILVGLFVWLYLASDGEADIVDEDPTLDTRGPD